MPELRKRKDPPPAPVPTARKSKTAKGANGSTTSAGTSKTPDIAGDTTSPPVAPASAAESTKDGPPAVNDTIDLKSFGGEVETNEGDRITLEALVAKSKAGVVLFTYPKASTPGCTYNSFAI